MKRTIFTTLVLSLMLISTTQAFFRYKDDTNLPDWSRDAVDIMRERNIMKGYTDGTFRPTETINRAQALTLITRTKEIEVPDTQEISAEFSDVPADAWFAPSVAYAYQQGWINGFPDKTFRPGKKLNRAEWATLLKRAFGMTPRTTDELKYDDVPSNTWFTDAVRSFQRYGLIRQSNVRDFQPSRAVTRADAAWNIQQILSKPALNGTSESNDFSEGNRLDSKRLAIKPRDFDPNNQGYESTRQELVISAEFDAEPVNINRDDSWTHVGNIRLTNEFESRVTLHSLELAVAFEATNIGPGSEFEVSIRGPELAKSQEFNRGNRSFFSGLELSIPAQDEVTLRVELQPKDSGKFYAKIGSGFLRIESVDASTIVDFSDVTNTRSNYQNTPILYAEGERKLTPFIFDPTIVTQ